jgi:L-lysine exporter family protein LysE/ArgO
MLLAFLHGYLLALGLILPLGPQNAFVFSQGATQPRFVRALPVVIAASLCDTLLVLLAVLGVSVIVPAVAWVRIALLAAGIVFLMVMGWLTWRAAPADDARLAYSAGWPLRRQIVFAASVSLLNPHAILDTLGVIGASSVSYSGDARIAFTAAVILNSWLWFIGLAVAGRLVGRWSQARRWLNRASALIMWVSAAYLLWSLLRP